MQPLISPVDHESRHNSAYRSDDETSTERTPLITSTQIARSIVESRNPITTIVVTLLLLMLVTGIAIGIYLLIEQQNLLPPVDPPLLFVSRAQWDTSNSSTVLNKLQKLPAANRVIVVQTDTNPCNSTKECVQTLEEIQRNFTVQREILPYNFMVSSNGETFEGLGWWRESSLYPEHLNTSLVLAFIGNFTASYPTRSQTAEAQRFFDESISQERLSPAFIIIGKNSKEKPLLLFHTLSKLPQWNEVLSD